MDQRITELLQSADAIAVVGMSDSPMRDSNRIGELLIDVGYTVYPVNPTLNSVFGLHSWPNVKSVPDQVDIVNVFRNSRYAKEVVQDAINAEAKVIWFQYGAEEPEAEQIAREAGLEVISGYCIAVEIRRRGIRRQSVD